MGKTTIRIFPIVTCAMAERKFLATLGADRTLVRGWSVVEDVSIIVGYRGGGSYGKAKEIIRKFEGAYNWNLLLVRKDEGVNVWRFVGGTMMLMEDPVQDPEQMLSRSKGAAMPSEVEEWLRRVESHHRQRLNAEAREWLFVVPEEEGEGILRRLYCEESPGDLSSAIMYAIHGSHSVDHAAVHCAEDRQQALYMVEQPDTDCEEDVVQRGGSSSEAGDSDGWSCVDYQESSGSSYVYHEGSGESDSPYPGVPHAGSSTRLQGGRLRSPSLVSEPASCVSAASERSGSVSPDSAERRSPFGCQQDGGEYEYQSPEAGPRAHQWGSTQLQGNHLRHVARAERNQPESPSLAYWHTDVQSPELLSSPIHDPEAVSSPIRTPEVVSSPICGPVPVSFPIHEGSVCSWTTAFGELDFRKRILIMWYFEEESDASTSIPIKKLKEWSDKAIGYAMVEKGIRRMPGARREKRIEFSNAGYCAARVAGAGRFLRVGLENNHKMTERSFRDHQEYLKRGFSLCQRKYEFFVYKDDLQDCFFFATETYSSYDRHDDMYLKFKTCEDVWDYFGDFRSAKYFAKFAKRLQLIFSPTHPAFELSEEWIAIVDDISLKDHDGYSSIATDGNGLIKRSLLEKVEGKVIRGMFGRKNQADYDQPAVIQVRAYWNRHVGKGTLTVVDKMPRKFGPHKMPEGKLIVFTRSMVKIQPAMVRGEPATPQRARHNCLEINETSHKPATANLSQYIILLLRWHGVPEEFFLRLVKNTVDDILTTHEHPHEAMKVLLRYVSGNSCYREEKLLDMLFSEFQPGEPFLKRSIENYLRLELKRISRGKLRLPNSYSLIGVADFTGRLQPNEVIVIMKDGPVAGCDVLVYKHPGYHPEDMKKMKATADYGIIRDLGIGAGRYCIIFSTQGPRSITDQMAGSDLDGDKYWVCFNHELVCSFEGGGGESFKPPEKPALETPNLRNFHQTEIQEQMIKDFLTAKQGRVVLSDAATSWLAWADLLVPLKEAEKLSPVKQNTNDGVRQRCARLQEICYSAVDAPTTGEKVESVPDDLRAPFSMEYLKKEKNLKNGSSTQSEAGHYSTTPIRNAAQAIMDGWNRIPPMPLEKDGKTHTTTLGKIFDSVRNSDHSR
ncbi:hypothetical protein CBR_g52061, partial [Chara braunii]